ncbi:catalase/peroxidase HPI [Hydrogenimonas sp.]
MKKCPFTHEDLGFTKAEGDMVAKWWPNRLNLKILQLNNDRLVPDRIEYAQAFETLDIDALVADLKKVMKTSQAWWPADWGHYGPLFIRLAWHSAGTYRLVDGKGGANSGNQRFAPVNSWPDNANLDKARRLLWPVKKRYGNAISWADLMILAGNVALEDMGFETLGFGGGRVDAWEAEIDTYWGSEEKWMEDKRRTENGKIKHSLGAAQMGLIYVNPEGPDGVPDVLGAAREIRDSFRRMGMNDEETIALIAGGHTFGKNHGAADPAKYLGPEPEAAPIEEQGLGWKNSYKSGKGPDTITSGLEGAWTPTPTRWDDSFLRILFKYEWNLQKSPAGAWQWVAVDPDEEDRVVDAHDPAKKSAPIMLTTDLALKLDPDFARISRRFLEDHALFQEAFAKAWFKLTHRDMGPRKRYLGPLVPQERFIWQDPIPQESYSKGIDASNIARLKAAIDASGASDQALLYTAWSAAAAYRRSDFKGGSDGARIALEPQKSFAINRVHVAETLETLEAIRRDFNTEEAAISLADLIVLGGSYAVEKAIAKAGFDLEVPVTIARGDATQDLTDTHAFQFLEPFADGFVNFLAEGCDLAEEEALLFKADQLGLTVAEMVVLAGGLRAMGVGYDEKVGIYGSGALDTSFFDTLTDMAIEWKPIDERLYEGVDRESGERLYTATRADLIFGANSELRAQSEFWAQEDNEKRFVHAFVKAWVKVMENNL